MPRGIYTQTVCLLLRDEVSWDQLRPALQAYTIRKEVAQASEWFFGGPTLVLDYRPDKNGYVAVDFINQRWPDGMGDPKQESTLFGAWSMGAFGPHTYPGGLQRAMQQCWAWDEGKVLPPQHRGFIRIRSSYAFGAADEDPLWPADYDAEQDLDFVTNVARALLTLPQALCYFNPGGEVLRDRAMVDESLEYGRDHELPPLELWSNVRLFNIDDSWSLMDTVGNSQLDLPDIEASFERRYDPGEVDGFLRNVTLYLLTNGDVIRDHNTLDGPGDIRWQAQRFDNGLCDPPRKVICFVPLDDSTAPAVVLHRPVQK